MNSNRHVIVAVVAAIFFSASASSHALSVGQVDTFEDGTTQGWTTSLVGMGLPPVPPANALGGPGGAGDHFLWITATGGGGPGSRLNVINFLSQWAGSYPGAGITSIAMDVNNMGSTELSLRLSFSDPVAGPPANVAFSADPIVVPPSSGWISVVFPIAAGDLLAGLGDVNTALMNATELRIYHSPADNFPQPGNPIPAIVAQLGVDNIRAVPEQGSTAVLFGAGLATVVALRPRSYKRSAGRARN